MKTYFLGIFAVIVLCFSTNGFAQPGHKLQVDDGAQHYSLIVGSNPGAVFTLPPGPAAQTILTSGGGSSGGWLLGGNTGAGANNQIGTLDGAALNFVTAGVGNVRMSISGTGLISMGGGSQLQVSATGNLTKINNVAYSWPGAQGAATTVLTNDGAGNLSWAAGGGTGQPKFTLSTKNANYAATNTDQLIQADISAGNITITLPNANTFAAGQTIVIKAIAPTNPGSGNQVNVLTTGGQLIDDGNAGFLIPFFEGQAVRLYSTGTADWYTW